MRSENQKLIERIRELAAKREAQAMNAHSKAARDELTATAANYRALAATIERQASEGR